MQYQLSISGLHYANLVNHLYPGDGLESIAIAICGRHLSENIHKLTVHELLLVPHSECERKPDQITWKTDRLIPVLEKVIKYDYAVLKIHSHPNGYEKFSLIDDTSDINLFKSVFGWTNNNLPHASAVMLPDKRIFGRIFQSNLRTDKIHKISIVSHTITIWNYSDTKVADFEIGKRTAQAFGEGTFKLLKQLRIGVIGCSGTGSPVIEQLVRLGVGNLILVDPDKIELKNLNRILNTGRQDAIHCRQKTLVIKDVIDQFDLGIKVEAYTKNIFDDVSCLKQLATCDILFGCVDTVDGRDLINRISTFYIIPYFDLGIKLEADGNGGINKIVGTVNYIQPGKSSLLSRGVYDSEDLKAAGLYRMYPNQYEDLVKNSYIKNINVGRPAVISVNMMIASYAVNEFLNRLHPYKIDPCENFAQTTIDLTESCFVHLSEEKLKVDLFLKNKVGKGDTKVFLELLELQQKNEKLD